MPLANCILVSCNLYLTLDKLGFLRFKICQFREPILKKVPNIKIVEFENRGHFTTEEGYNNDEFPELLAECLEI